MKMDSILKESASFSKFYVHKPGTAGSVFASITGLPDIDDVKTVSRNPLAIDQRIIFDQYNGYEKRYFIGGSANWANIRAVFQSNIEGELIDKIQEIGFSFDGIILNAAAYTHTSVGIGDAIKAIETPVIEVHISNTFSREEFRHQSYISPNAKGVILGFGLHSYELALQSFL